MLKTRGSILFIAGCAILLAIGLLSLKWFLVKTHRVMSADPNSYVVLKRKEISPAYEVVSVLVKPGTDLEVIRSLVERTCEGICDIYMYDSADQPVGFTNFDVGGVVRSPNRGP